MSTAPQYIPHYTVADYAQWKGDWELWQGIAVAMTPSPFGRHQHCSLQIARALLTAIEAQNCGAVVLQAIDWIISDDTVVRPDVVVLCGEIPERHVTKPPTLVVEILSAGTADRDRNNKLRLYEESGVDHYLIVDPNNNTLDSYSRNEQGRFSLLESSDSLDFVISEDCHIAMDVASIF